ncbi:hypothetical protein BDV41DRAFT_227454 [Aspergillus transmontanensis]|uniref:Uncharacterized protein n=1 Tax=Aspergillus transmontanensis TaxID=1034304 RepID=A0A5N6WED2_9EURO|nr:hypothetical protein BDV41DRAFT_227454 [Aspergillus transmontanensis]
MSDTRLMDTEPGGESTQYESIREFTQTPAKQTGQLGAQGNMPHTRSEMMQLLDPDTSSKAEDEDDEWARRFSGQSGAMGEVDKDLKPETQDGDAEAARSRRQQGYGPGSGVGA